MSPLKKIRIDESMIEGAISNQYEADWIRPWRLPFSELPLFPTEDGLQARANMSAGVRLHIATDSDFVNLCILPKNEGRKFDLTIANKLLGTESVNAGDEKVCFDNLPPGEKTLEIWLPQSTTTELRELEIAATATLRVPRDKRLKWITYGSSISHCGATHSPARTWPGTVARERNLNLTCLGYGGQCHIDSMIARMIRDTPADFISLKLGINVQGGASLNARSFKPAIIGSVKIIREKHPTTPLALISPIISPPRETTKNIVGFTLEQMRIEVEDAARRLTECGDENLTYVNGLELFGPDLVDAYLPDLLHPNGDGYEIMGHNFVKAVYDPIMGKQ